MVKFGLPGARPEPDVYNTDPEVLCPEPRHFSMPPLATFVHAPGDWSTGGWKSSTHIAWGKDL
eukprot:gene46723-30034_t